jgi:hypothetical protein
MEDTNKRIKQKTTRYSPPTAIKVRRYTKSKKTTKMMTNKPAFLTKKTKPIPIIANPIPSIPRPNITPIATTAEQLSDIHFAEETDMKLLLLSLFAHDPCHDFQSATRTFNKKNDPSGSGQDIFEKLQLILNSVSTKRIGKAEAIAKPRVQTVNVQMPTKEVKEYIQTEFVPDFTNHIFSDAIAESIHLSSGYTINETENTVEAKRPNQRVNLAEVSERIVATLAKNLEKYSVTSLSFYDVYAIPIKTVLNADYAIKRGQVNTQLFKALNQAIVQAESGLAEFLFEQADSLEPFQMYKETPEEDRKLIAYIQSRPVNAIHRCASDIQKISVENYRTREIANCMDDYLRYYRLTYHVDRARQNTQFLKSVFPDKPTLEELQTALTKENQDYLEKVAVFAKKLKSLYGTQSTQYGGNGNPELDELSEMNKHILVEIVRWMLLYLNCAIEFDQGNSVVFLPSFVDVSSNDDNVTKAKKYLLNAQILILYCFYYEGTSYKAALTNIINKRRESMSPKKFPDYLSPYLMEEDSANGENVKKWLSSDIDMSIKKSSEIILRNMLPQYIVYDGNSLLGKQVIDINALIRNERTNGKRYIINNASSIGPKSFPNADTNIINEVYCPATSIADAMFNCGYSDAIKEQSDAIYPMRIYIENDAGPKYIYSIGVFPSKTDKKILSINGVVTVEGNPITIDIYKNINLGKYRDKELSATIAYRDTVTQILDLLQSSEINTIVNLTKAERVNKMEKFRNFVRMNAKRIIEFVCIKSIGDWGQEVTSVAKLGAYYKNNVNEINEIMDKSNIIPYDANGDALRLGVAGDRPSAFRMIYMNVFANENAKNRKSLVGYIAEDATKNFLVYTPSSYPRSYVSAADLAKYRVLMESKAEDAIPKETKFKFKTKTKKAVKPAMKFKKDTAKTNRNSKKNKTQKR